VGADSNGVVWAQFLQEDDFPPTFVFKCLELEQEVGKGDGAMELVFTLKGNDCTITHEQVEKFLFMTDESRNRQVQGILDQVKPLEAFCDEYGGERADSRQQLLECLEEMEELIQKSLPSDEERRRLGEPYHVENLLPSKESAQGSSAAQKRRRRVLEAQSSYNTENLDSEKCKSKAEKMSKDLDRFKIVQHRPTKNNRLPDEAQFCAFDHVGFPVNLGYVSDPGEARIMSHASKTYLDSLVIRNANDQKKL